MTNNEFNVSLFVLFIYSLPCPALFFLIFFSIASRAQTGVILVTSTPQIRSLVTKFSKMAVFSSSDPLKLFGISSLF